MLPALVLVPAVPCVGALIALIVKSESRRPLLLPLVALLHLALTVVVLRDPERGAFTDWLQLDAPGRLVLLLVSVLFLACSIYAVGYLRERTDRPNRVFCACLLLFLGMMSLIMLSHHLGLMWVALEATTLSSGPLIYFNRTTRALEATWKYLMVGSVGVALALFGSFFLGVASLQGGHDSSLLFSDLLMNAGTFSRPWLRGAFVLLLVGYGTKMGLAPMHTWKPDAYGEAPGIVGSLLAGGMTSCSFLAILRVYQVVVAGGEQAFADRILCGMGLLSMAVAGVFMIRQKDFKRLLAYSSVEHMGILVLGLSLGPVGAFGALLHLVFNGLVKGVMFLAAGNLHRSFGSKSTDVVTGALRRLPFSGAVFLAGFLAVTGSPPFAPFTSLFTILNAALGQDRIGVAVAMLVFLLIVFTGMGATVLAVTQGSPPERPQGAYRERLVTVLPPLALLALVVLLGVWQPPFLRALVDDVVQFLGQAALEVRR